MEDNDGLVQIPNKHSLQNREERPWEILLTEISLMHACSVQTTISFKDYSHRVDKDQKENHIFMEIWKEYPASAPSPMSEHVFLGPLPPGHCQGREKDCFCGPCRGTWIPHSGRLCHPALWWAWRGSALYRSPLRGNVNTDRAFEILNTNKSSNLTSNIGCALQTHPIRFHRNHIHRRKSDNFPQSAADLSGLIVRHHRCDFS